MMPRTRLFVRSLLAVLIVGACLAAAVAPVLRPARAAPQAALVKDQVIISSFRFVGSGGPGDQYVELYNNTSGPIDLTGAVLRWSNLSTTDVLYSAFNGVTLPAAGYYLLGGPDYNDSTGVDACYSIGIDSTNGGVALFADATHTNSVDAIDQAGFSQDGYAEVNASNPQLLAPLTGNVDHSYVRKQAGGNYADTNDNSADFISQNPSAPHNDGGAQGTCGNPTETPAPNTFTIKGNVQASGVTLTYVYSGGTKTATSDSSGNYSLSAPSGSTGTVTPKKDGFTFNPSHIAYSNITSNQNNQDYDAILTAPTLMSVLISEVGWMGTAASAADQWIELYNPNSYGVNVTNLQLIGTGIGPSGQFNLSDAGLTNDVLPGHGFLLLEDSAGVFKNLPADTYTYQGITYSLKTKNVNVSLSTYGQFLYLRLSTNFLYVDHVFESKWPAGNNTSASTRASMERHKQDYDSTTAWLTFAGTAHPKIVQDRNGDNVKGTPGEPNWADTVNPTPMPTSTHYKTATPRPPTPFGHMVINEFLPRAGFDWNQDGSVDVYDEFVELKNLGPVAANLSGWKIDIISPGGPSSYPLTGTMQPDQRMVIYSLKSHLSLYDSGGTVRLINNRGIVVDARSYGPVQSPDQSTCRIPDGYYWRFPCFPTPGLENSQTGTLPVPPPVIASQQPPCLLADTVPDPFKQAECYGYGADIFNPAYWDDQSGFNNYPVPDVIDKNGSVVK